MSDVRGERNQTKWCPKRNAILRSLFPPSLLLILLLFPPRHWSCPLLLLTLFPIAETVYDASLLGFARKNPMNADARARTHTHV